jgi:hypothetical protein
MSKQALVENRELSTQMFAPIGWVNCRQARAAKLTEEEVRHAVATARTLRRLTPCDLKRGAPPSQVVEFVEEVIRLVAEHDHLIVTHDPDHGLGVLLRSIETWMGIDLLPVNVVCTGVLERARHLGLRQDSGESDADFYGRIAGVEGELPDLLSCYRDQECADLSLRTTHEMFPAIATYVIYQHHFGGRLLRDGPGSSIVE